jgi:CxxC motif-containing protein
VSEQKKFTCIGCPIGCPLQLTHEGTEVIEVEGYECNRGAKYARQEFTDPRRSLTTTVRLEGALWNRLPVKVTQPIPKERVLEAADAIHALTVKAPIRTGDVLIRDILGLQDINVVATRSADKK